jgi:hypothetical protein
LYGLLKRMSDNPMVELNRAIAAAGDGRRPSGRHCALPGGGGPNDAIPERHHLSAQAARLAAGRK